MNTSNPLRAHVFDAINTTDRERFIIERSQTNRSVFLVFDQSKNYIKTLVTPKLVIKNTTYGEFFTDKALWSPVKERAFIFTSHEEAEHVANFFNVKNFVITEYPQ